MNVDKLLDSTLLVQYKSVTVHDVMPVCDVTHLLYSYGMTDSTELRRFTFTLISD